jgi:hypothetical protein
MTVASVPRLDHPGGRSCGVGRGGGRIVQARRASGPNTLASVSTYKRVKTVLALPLGPERMAALHAAKIDDRRQH